LGELVEEEHIDLPHEAPIEENFEYLLEVKDKKSLLKTESYQN
jgi:hypothetical protein